MKFLTLAAGIALALGGVAATAPALAQGHPGMHDNGRHDRGRGYDRRDDRRWNNNHHRRCRNEWRHHRRVRICR